MPVTEKAPEEDEKIVINSDTPVAATAATQTDENLLKSMMNGMSLEAFVQTPAFIAAVQALAVKKGIDPMLVVQDVARTFLTTANDVGINAVNTAEEFLINILDVAHGTLVGVTKTTAGLGRGLVNTVTLQPAAKR